MHRLVYIFQFIIARFDHDSIQKPCFRKRKADDGVVSRASPIAASRVGGMWVIWRSAEWVYRIIAVMLVLGISSQVRCSRELSQPLAVMGKRREKYWSYIYMGWVGQWGLSIKSLPERLNGRRIITSCLVSIYIYIHIQEGKHILKSVEGECGKHAKLV